MAVAVIAWFAMVAYSCNFVEGNRKGTRSGHNFRTANVPVRRLLLWHAIPALRAVTNSQSEEALISGPVTLGFLYTPKLGYCLLFLRTGIVGLPWN